MKSYSLLSLVFLLALGAGQPATAGANDVIFNPGAGAASAPLVIASTDDDMVAVKLNNGQTGFRWITRTNTPDGSTVNTLQLNATVDVSVSFFKNKVRIDLQSSTGSTFDGSWGDTGVGNKPTALNYFLRRLSLTMSPVNGLEISMGSMAPYFGAGTENSYFDADGYIMGYRAKAVIKGNEIVVTGGYVGDYKDPNVFDRLNRMAEFNFVQAAITRSIGEIVKASIEYDHIESYDYARAAVQVNVARWVKLIDTITVEDMTRLSVDAPANILAVKVAKKFSDVFAGRDLEAAVTYTYRTDDMKVMLGDKVFMGQAVRLTLTAPNLIKTGRMTLGTYLDYIQRLDDLSQFRAEGGMIIKF